MPDKDPDGSKRADRADWSNAWDVVARLAAARETTLRAAAQDRRQASGRAAKRGAMAASKPDAISEQQPADNRPGAHAQVAAMDHDQLARAVAEIEMASAALREAEPALEVGLPSAPTHRRKYWSVWILVAAVWISATLVVAGTTGAILFLFG
jgi:CHASE3 domain sensor protein